MQSALLRSLGGQAEPAQGFDRRELEAAAHSLRRKRARAAARAWPSLFAALGVQADGSFADFAKAMPLPEVGGPLADGRAFVDYLASDGQLPDAGRLEAFFVDLHHTRTQRGLVPRKGTTLKVAMLTQLRRIVVGFRLPVVGVRWFSLPLRGCTRTNPKD